MLLRNKKTGKYFELTCQEFDQLIEYHNSRQDYGAIRNLEVCEDRTIIEIPEELTQIVQNDSGRKKQIGEFPKKDSGKKPK